MVGLHPEALEVVRQPFHLLQLRKELVDLELLGLAVPELAVIQGLEVLQLLVLLRNGENG